VEGRAIRPGVSDMPAVPKAVLGTAKPLYLFVFTHFRTQSCFALLLEML